MENLPHYLNIALSAASASALSMVYVSVLASMNLPFTVLLIAFNISFYILYRVSSGCWSDISQSLKNTNIMQTLSIFILFILSALAIYPEFYYALNIPAGSSLVIFGKLFSGIASLGFGLLLLRNALELIQKLSQASRGHELLWVCIFYIGTVWCLGSYLGVMPVTIPLIYNIQIVIISLIALFKVNKNYLISYWNEMTQGVIKGNHFFAVLRFISRIVDRMIAFVLTSLHFLAESFLPATGILRSPLSLPFAISAQTQAIFLLFTLTIAEAMQDFEGVVGTDLANEMPVGGKQSFSRFVISSLFIVSMIGLTYFNWLTCLATYLSLRLVVPYFIDSEIATIDRQRFRELYHTITSSLTLDRIAVVIVTALAGYCAAYEIKMLLPLSVPLLYAFAVSGAYVESSVYIDSIERVNNAQKSESINADSAKEIHYKNQNNHAGITSLAAFVCGQ